MPDTPFGYTSPCCGGAECSPMGSCGEDGSLRPQEEIKESLLGPSRRKEHLQLQHPSAFFLSDVFSLLWRLQTKLARLMSSDAHTLQNSARKEPYRNPELPPVSSPACDAGTHKLCLPSAGNATRAAYTLSCSPRASSLCPLWL